MHLDAKSNHIFFISDFYVFRLFIDYWESTVKFKRRVPLFDPGIEFLLSLGILNAMCHNSVFIRKNFHFFNQVFSVSC